MSAWSDDDGFWEAMEPALCAPGRLALAEGDVEAMLSGLGLPPGRAVLDLGCGPGAHAISFAAHGHRVTGVDRSRRLLDRARSAARAAGVDVEWVEADIRRFRRPASYHLICSLYTSFGYFDDPDNRMVLEHARASLVPGGAFLLDVIGREAVVRAGLDARSAEVGGVCYKERRRLADGGQALVSDWTVVREGRRQDFPVRLRLYSASELRDLLQSTGFATVTIAGALNGTGPYDEAATRLVAVAYAAPGAARIHGSEP
jgi:SAM-dependent methyltransferase